MPRPEEPIGEEELVVAQIQQETRKKTKKRPASKEIRGVNKRVMDNNSDTAPEEMEVEVMEIEESSTPCPIRQEEPPKHTHTRTRSNLSPFVGVIPRYYIGKTPKASSIEEALEIARNLVIQAANLAENNPT